MGSNRMKTGQKLIAAVMVMTLCMIAIVMMTAVKVCAEEAAKTIVYVSLSGNDENDGTSLETSVATLGKAIDIAMAGDAPREIRIEAGTYTGINYHITDSVKIIGLDKGTDKVVLDANNEGRLFYMEFGESAEKLELENLTLINATGYGAAVYSFANNVILKDVTISDCAANAYLIRSGGNLTVDNTVISGSQSGNVIQQDESGDISITDSKFEDNSCVDTTSTMAVININSGSGDINISNSSFTGNTARQGVIRGNYNYNITITNSKFVDNTNTIAYGGAVYSNGGKLTVSGSTFIGNKAYRSGGAIYVGYRVTATITDSIFINNQCNGMDYGYYGDAIYNGNKLTINNSAIISDPTVISNNYLIYNDGEDNVVNAQYNWWGTNSDPSGLNGVGYYEDDDWEEYDCPPVDVSNWVTMSATYEISEAGTTITASFDKEIPDGLSVSFSSGEWNKTAETKNSVAAVVDTSETPHGEITVSCGNEAIQLSIHKLIFTAEGAVLKAACSADGCTQTDHKGTLTIEAPTGNLTYDGTGKAATISGDTDILGTPEIIYKKGDTEILGTPTDAGEYTASITLGGATASTVFEIEKAASALTVAPTVITNLAYDGQDHALISEGTVSGGSFSYVLGTNDQTAPETGWGDGVPVGKNAGNYYVWYKIVGDANHTGIAATALTPVKISPKTGANVTVTLNSSSLTYTGSEQTVTVSSVKFGNEELTKDDYDISGDISATELGTYTVTITLKGNYSGTGTAEWKIEKAESVIDKAPEAKTTLTYTGSAQELVIKGNVTGGELQYALVTDATTAPEISAYTKDIPTATNAGTYYVWYKVVGDDNHTGIGETVLTPVKITSKSGTDVTVTLNSNSLTYTGSEQDVTVSSVKLGEEVLKAEDYDISGDISKTDAGTYILTATLKGNYSGTGTAEWKIEKAESVIDKVPEAKTTLTYTGSAQELVTKGNVTGGELQYALVTDATTAPETSAYTKDIPTATNAGTYYVWYKVVGDANHTGIAATALTPVKISPKTGANVTVTLNRNSLTYTGSEQDVTVSSVKLGEEILKAEDYDISGDISATDAGTYTVAVTLKGNYSGTGTAEWKIEKATPVIDKEPKDLKAVEGQKLSDINLPTGWSWIDESELVGSAGVNTFKARYTPADTANYNVIEDIEIQIVVTTPTPTPGTVTTPTPTPGAVITPTLTPTPIPTPIPGMVTTPTPTPGAKTTPTPAPKVDKTNKTVENNRDGSKTTTEIIEYADGSKGTTVVKEDASGNEISSKTTTVKDNKDGGQTTTTEIKKADGSTTYEVEKSDKDGNVTKEGVYSTAGESTVIKKQSINADGEADKKNYTVETSGMVKLSKVKTDSATVTIPSKVKINGEKYTVDAIAKNAFAENKATKTVKIAKTVKKIAKGAFKNASNLKKVVIHATENTKISKGAFDGIADDAVFYIYADKATYKKMVRMIKKSGVSNTVKFVRKDPK